MIENEVVFITGGAGFIGTALTQRLLEKNTVIVYDSFLRNSLQYYPEMRRNRNLVLVKGDIRDKEKIKSSVQNSTIVFHLAAIAGVSKYFSIPAEVMETNIIGTYNILEAAKGNRNIQALFDFSTSEIYGSNCFRADEAGDVRMENLSEKRWTYATSKIASEKLCLSYFWQHEVPFIGIRPFNIYGPGQVGEGVISYFLNNARRNEPIRITGDGGQARTYCYIDDFLDGLGILLRNLPDAVGESYNIGTYTELATIWGLGKLVKEVTGCTSRIEFTPHQGEDVMVRSPNITKMQKLGYEPRVGLKEGLKRTYDWYCSSNITLD